MRNPKDTSVLAMDGSKMLLLCNGGDVMKPVLKTAAQEEADNPLSSITGADRPGRAFSRASPRRSFLTQTSWRDEAKKDFAQEMLKFLQAHQQERGGDVIVLAAPSVLGEFQKRCPDILKQAILAELAKDVVNHSSEKMLAITDAA